MTKMPEHKDPEPVLMDGIVYTGDKGPRFGIRHVQVLIMGFGLAITFSSKSLLSVAIVAMTNSTSPNPNIPTYDWDNKSVIVSSILWSGIPFNILAGYLGKRYGPKWFVVGSAAVNSLFFMLIPLFAQLGGSTGVIVCRVIEGVALGFLNPLHSVVMGRWVPLEERSRLSFLGAGILTLFVMVANISTGFISESDMGWPGIFYIFGAIGFVWTALYAFIGVQSADVHPRITPKEKKYIETTLFRTTDNEPMPLKQIISNIHVWAAIVGQAGCNWTIVILSTEMSIYTSKVLQFDVMTNGTVAALPPLLATISGVPIAFFSDFIPKRKILSVVNSRRTFHLIGVIGFSLAFIFMTYIPVEYKIWTVALLCAGDIFVLISGIGGANINILDISPKYAGIISGLRETAAQSVGLFAPLTVQWICTDESDASQWRIVFLVAGAISIAAGIFFSIFATDKRQAWETESDQEAEIETQKRKASIISITSGMGA